MAARRSAGELMMGVGVGREGPEWVDLAKAYNLLFGGAIGGGKSTIINQGLIYLAETHDPGQLQLLLFDLKGGDGVEFGMFNGLPHLVRPVVSRLEDCEEAFEELAQDLAVRFEALSRLDVKRIETYNAAPAFRKQALGLPIWMPRKVVAVDEFARIWAIGKPAVNKVMTTIEACTATGRAAGVHFIFATQRPEVDVIPGLIQNNILGRGAFKVGDQQTSEMLLGKGDYRAAALPPEDPGLMVWKYRTSSRVRAILISEEEAERRLKRLSNSTIFCSLSPLGEERELSRQIAPELEPAAEEPVERSAFSSSAPRVDDEQRPLNRLAHDLLARASGTKLPVTSRISSRW